MDRPDDTRVRHPAEDSAGQRLFDRWIKPGEVRKPPAQHDDIGIEDIDDDAEGPRRALDEPIHRGRRPFVPGLGHLRDLSSCAPYAGNLLKLALEA
jgi:hypothetical protein